jgi:hypothetical protein
LSKKFLHGFAPHPMKMNDDEQSRVLGIIVELYLMVEITDINRREIGERDMYWVLCVFGKLFTAILQRMNKFPTSRAGHAITVVIWMRRSSAICV